MQLFLQQGVQLLVEGEVRSTTQFNDCAHQRHRSLPTRHVEVYLLCAQHQALQSPQQQPQNMQVCSKIR